MFNKNKIKLFFILLLLQAGIVFSQTATFTFAGGGDYYNFDAAESDNGPATGGIMLVGTDMAQALYDVQVEFTSTTGAIGGARVINKNDDVKFSGISVPNTIIVKESENSAFP